MRPVLLEVWSLRKRRDQTMVMATGRTLQLQKSLHSYEVKVRDVCLGDQICPGAPNGFCKRGTPRGAVKPQHGNLWEEGLLRIKDLRGSHKEPARHLGQRATRERYQMNKIWGQPHYKVFTTIHKVLCEKELTLELFLPWPEETSASSQQFQATKTLPVPYISLLPLSFQALEEQSIQQVCGRRSEASTVRRV